jgi:hypothetical protein
LAEEPVIEMERRMQAGLEYVSSLRKLGFDPEIAAWAIPRQRPGAPDVELILVTSWADNIGPKAIYDLLFEAYDASATPREIDPFVVTLISPHTQVATDLKAALVTMRHENFGPHDRPMFILGMVDYTTIPQWIISHRDVKPARFEDLRRFAAFHRNVTALAA